MTAAPSIGERVACAETIEKRRDEGDDENQQQRREQSRIRGE